MYFSSVFYRVIIAKEFGTFFSSLVKMTFEFDKFYVSVRVSKQNKTISLSLVYYFTEQTLFAYWIHIERTVIGLNHTDVNAPIKFIFYRL